MLRKLSSIVLCFVTLYMQHLHWLYASLCICQNVHCSLALLVMVKVSYDNATLLASAIFCFFFNWPIFSGVFQVMPDPQNLQGNLWDYWSWIRPVAQPTLSKH